MSSTTRDNEAVALVQRLPSGGAAVDRSSRFSVIVGPATRTARLFPDTDDTPERQRGMEHDGRPERDANEA